MTLPPLRGASYARHLHFVAPIAPAEVGAAERRKTTSHRGAVRRELVVGWCCAAPSPALTAFGSLRRPLPHDGGGEVWVVGSSTSLKGTRRRAHLAPATAGERSPQAASCGAAAG